MSLILAVEPDRRQAKQLSSVVRQHVRAELVVVDSGAKAVEALAGRIPDLVLTPPLLPPKDEAVLTGWLRDLGDAAAHVQTLAIPILSEGDTPGREQGSSIFGRKQQSDAGPGCDPGVFADQVRVYLDRADVERSSRVQPEPAAHAQSETTPAPVMAATEDAAPDVEEFDEAMTFDDLVFEAPASDPAPAQAPVPVAEPPVTMRTPTPFARPEKRVDPAVLRSWESELGLESSPAATPLWRVHQETSADTSTDEAPAGAASFNPADARYAPLFRRLDELAVLHA